MNEIEIIKGLLKALESYKVYADELPLDYNFNSIGIYYILDSVIDSIYKDEYNLEIHLVGKNSDKINIIKLCEDIHLLINKKQLTNYSRVITKNVRRNYLKEEDGNHHYILEYYVENLRGI